MTSVDDPAARPAHQPDRPPSLSPPPPASSAPPPPPSVPPPAPSAAPRLPAAPAPVAPPAPPPGTPGQLPQSTIDAMRWDPTPTWKPAGRPRGSFFARWFAFRAIWLVVALVIGGVGSAWEKFGPGNDANQSADAPTEWAPEVLPIAQFVEAERGLRFDHVVPVEFLAEAEFVDLFSYEGDNEPDDETLQHYEHRSDLYNAAGLAADIDLYASENTYAAVSTLGLYVPSFDTIYVRGDELTPPVRAVLAHELTHALQEQHFSPQLGGHDDLSVRSILEADALRVENVYIESLSSTEQDAAFAGLTIDDSTSTTLESLPSALVEQGNAPYVLGPLLVNSVYAQSGNHGVNQLLLAPPSEEVLVNPWLFGTDQAEAEPMIERPPNDVIIEDAQPLSLLDTLSMLDAWLPWAQARGAVDGWAGGTYVSYVRDDGRACFSVNAEFDGSPEPFRTAVADWAAAAGSDAHPMVDGRGVTFEACDRGAGAAAPPPPVVPLTTALYLEITALDTVSPDEVPGLKCVVRTMLDDADAGPLLVGTDELTPEESDIITWVRAAADDSCGLTSEG